MKALRALLNALRNSTPSSTRTASRPRRYSDEGLGADSGATPLRPMPDAARGLSRERGIGRRGASATERAGGRCARTSRGRARARARRRRGLAAGIRADEIRGRPAPPLVWQPDRVREGIATLPVESPASRRRLAGAALGRPGVLDRDAAAAPCSTSAATTPRRTSSASPPRSTIRSTRLERVASLTRRPASKARDRLAERVRDRRGLPLVEVDQARASASPCTISTSSSTRYAAYSYVTLVVPMRAMRTNTSSRSSNRAGARYSTSRRASRTRARRRRRSGRGGGGTRCARGRSTACSGRSRRRPARRCRRSRRGSAPST